jgi:rhodanese-related sulfurtransferase
MKKIILLILLSINAVVFSATTPAKPKPKPVYLEPGVIAITVVIDGKPLIIKRNQDRKHLVAKFFQKTSRGIIKPLHPFKPHNIETLAELEVIEYIKQISAGNHEVLIIDARKPIWPTITGSIPGATHVPFHHFLKKEYALEIMEDEFGVIVNEKQQLDFSKAKTLVIYCNGNWCKMSPTLIRELLSYGYPAEKIKYYRGGMQAWQLLGLTVVK